MSRVRAVFLGTPDIARHCLQAMLDDEHYEVVGVVSQPDRPAGRKLQLTPSPVKALALARNIRRSLPIKLRIPTWWPRSPRGAPDGWPWSSPSPNFATNFLDLFPSRVVNVARKLAAAVARGRADPARADERRPRDRRVSAGDGQKSSTPDQTLGHRVIPLDDEINAVQLYDRCQELGAS